MSAVVSGIEHEAMRRALTLAAEPQVRFGPNPRVGCVLLNAAGRTVGEGAHRGAGTPHAEAAALAAAGQQAQGGTAVVTLEPCDHTGRTGPCTRALLDAGVRRVVFAQSDPNPVAAGGSRTLRAAGLQVEGGLLAKEAEALNAEWNAAVRTGRPHVTWKYAATLDGRVAAVDGSSRWITGQAARREVHALRASVDAVVVGTGTALTDDPHLAARDPDGTPLPRSQQPLRVVVGTRDLPVASRVLDDAAHTVHVRSREPEQVLATLWEHDVRRVLLEGGPQLAGAFLTAGLIDRVVGYVAPALLGDGPSALTGTGVQTIGAAMRLTVTDVSVVGGDVRITAVPVRPPDAAAATGPTATDTAGRTRQASQEAH
jgi:diaminohydroxyphosphoribosylaminopyrimidine deaminase/5-amino-6-(5-phosphoribosylamino)uracil reductase